jgi:uncharacterized protein
MAKGLGPFVVGIAEQRRAPAHPRPVTVAGPLPGLRLSDAWVPDDAEVTADLQLELLVDGRLTATGVIRAPWDGRCRRCLQDVEGELVVDTSEVFEPHPAEDAETYPLSADRVDLEPMIRDALLLALPLAPLCRDDCAGPDPDEHPVGIAGDEDAATPDPRWSALGELRFD